MRVVIWLVRLAVFAALFGFALMNTDPIEVRFYLGMVFQAPTVVFLMGFLAAGAVLGLLAMLPALWRQRRELGKQRKDFEAQRQEIESLRTSLEQRQAVTLEPVVSAPVDLSASPRLVGPL